MDFESTLTGVAQGIDTATKNLFNIMVLKQKINQEKESFTIDKKIKELEIKKAEFLLDPEQLQAEKDKLQAETNARNAQYTLNLLKVDEEQKKAQRDLETHNTAMAVLQQFIKNPQALPDGANIKMGDITVSRTRMPNYDPTVTEFMSNKENNKAPTTSSGFDVGAIFGKPAASTNDASAEEWWNQ